MGYPARFFFMSEHLAETIQRIQAVIEPVLEREGFELVELEYKRGSKRFLLRVTIDRLGRTSFAPPARDAADGEGPGAGGVTIVDCVRVTKLLSPVLDVEDVVPGAYTFEVSSPGVNRPLKTAAHFRMALGQKVRVKTRVPVAGQSFFIAKLVDADDERLVLEGKSGPIEVPYRHVSKANLEYEF